MRKTFLSVLITIVVIWLVHGMFLIKISKLEIAINADRKALETVEKDLNKKIIEYDAKVDLEKIGKEMRLKNKMEISDSIKFFQIEE